MQDRPADIGLIGLGVMGRSLALNLADHGARVAVYNRTAARTQALIEAQTYDPSRFIGCQSLGALAAAVRRPRPILLMVEAGAAVDAQLEELEPILSAGDIVIDGGNAHVADTIRRDRAASAKGLDFLGAGISGGEEGARHGPSIMVGGGATAYARVAGMLEGIAARVDGMPCCARLGPNGAGHFVKTMHNGIEYADMQLIAEIYLLLQQLVGLANDDMAVTFAAWNDGELNSYLIEITAGILRTRDPHTGQALVDVILDRAGQKGTGQWSSVAALELGVPAPTITEAVAARALSSLKTERAAAANAYRALVGAAWKRLPIMPTVDDLRDALLAAKVCAYAQGYAVMAAASQAHDWNLDLATVSRIWRGGCIIRAGFLNHIAAAVTDAPELPNLLIAPYFKALMRRTHLGLRRAVAAAAVAGLPTPALSSALAYLDGYRRERLPANMIQAQRDYFGAHTFERTDKPGAFHFDWLDA